MRLLTVVIMMMIADMMHFVGGVAVRVSVRLGGYNCQWEGRNSEKEIKLKLERKLRDEEEKYMGS